MDKKLQNDLDSADLEMEQIKNELLQIEMKRKHISDQRSLIACDAHQKRVIGDAVSERISSLQCEKNKLVEQVASVDDETNRVIASLDRYKQINAMNDAFYVWYAGPYATINSFRLGNLTNKPIEFTEINAALGQAALVVHIIAGKAGVVFKHFVIVPMGSFPKILRADDRRTSYPLFIDSSSFSLFPKRNFNLALQGFMSCVQELGDYIANYDPTLSLPYKISVSESRVGDLSFTYGGDDEVWTRSLKFMLSDVKWIIAWYIKHCNSSIVGSGGGGAASGGNQNDYGGIYSGNANG